MIITILSGSARKDNNTLRVALAMGKQFENFHQVNLIDFVNYDIPLMAQGGLNPNNLSSFQQDLIQKVNEAQVVIIVTPEYNWSTTPEILNMLHYLPNKPFQQIFANKVFGLVGVSTGRGGKVPALHLIQILNKLISFSNLESVVSPKIFESQFTKEVLDENGNSLENKQYDLGLADFCNYTMQIANRWFGIK